MSVVLVHGGYGAQFSCSQNLTFAIYTMYERQRKGKEKKR